MAFHEVDFPLALSRRVSGGPERRTEIVALISGHEERNQLWADSRRRYDAGTGLRALDDIHTLVAFFEARRGRLFGFRFRDPLDHKSCPAAQSPSALDQVIGTGDGVAASFQLVKAAGEGLPMRTILKPVEDTVTIAVNGTEQQIDTAFEVDTTSGLVTFLPGHVPPADGLVTAGFEFDLPVRFDSDELTINLAAFGAGDIPSIPLIELVL